MGNKLELIISAQADKWEQELGEAAIALQKLSDNAQAAGLSLDKNFEQQVEDADQAIKKFIQTAQKSDFSISPAAASTVAKMRMQIVNARKDYTTFAKSATQDAGTFTQALDKNRFVITEGARAVDDFFAAFQTGGVSGGLRGAANNITTIGAMLGPIGALATTAGVILGSVLIPKLLESGDAAEKAEKKLEDFEKRLASIDARIKQGAKLEALIDVGDVDAIRGEIEGLDTDIASLQARIEQTTKQIQGSRRQQTRITGSRDQGFREVTETVDTEETKLLRKLLSRLEEQLAQAKTTRDQAQQASPLAEREKQAKEEADARKKREEGAKKEAEGIDKQKRAAERELAQRRAKAEAERQKEIDQIAGKMVGTFEEVIAISGDLEDASDKLKTAFTDLGADALVVSAALKQARQTAQANAQQRQALDAITQGARQKQLDALEAKGDPSDLQTLLDARGSQTFDQQVLRRALQAQQDAAKDGGRLSLSKAKRQARADLEARLERVDAQETQGLETDQQERIRQAELEAGGALTQGERRDLEKQFGQERKDLIARQRDRRRGRAPIGVDLDTREGFGDPAGEGDPGTDAADAVSGMANSNENLHQQQAQGLAAVGSAAKQHGDRLDVLEVNVRSLVDNLRRTLGGRSGQRGRP